MKLVVDYIRELARGAVAGWRWFWFTPADPATLAVIRILAGAMLFYTHLVWGTQLEEFFGPRSWVAPGAAMTFYTEDVLDADGQPVGTVVPAYWSLFWHVESPTALWALHIAALVTFACVTLGLATRVATVLGFAFAMSYANRVPGALFGLDQINLLLAMYLMVGPAGAAYSLDRWLAGRGRAGGPAPRRPSVSANLAIRLIQVHMCVIYFYAGASKLQGGMWWSGYALWGAFANQEYQTLDMTWLAHYPLVIALLSHLTVYWELFYPALIWPARIRPLMLAAAVGLHLGIAFCMGMITFGLAMLIGNLAFVEPAFVRRLIEGPAAASEADGAERAGPPTWSAATRRTARGAA